MGTAIDRSKWGAEADALFAEIEAWRREHPAATLDAIEHAVEERLARLREGLLTDTVHASARTDLGTGAARVTCPECGGRLQRRGATSRTVQTGMGAMVTVRRGCGSCPRCKARVFPPGPGTGVASK